MKTIHRSFVGVAVSLGLAAASMAHAGTITDLYTPLPANDGIARTNSTFPNPGAPFVVAPGVTQTILFQGDSPSGLTLPRGGNGAQGPSFDQIAINTVGPDAGRFLFTVTETNGNSGVVRFDKQTGVATLIAQPPNGQRFDMARFTPWGTVVAAEETSSRLPGSPAGLAPTANNGVVYEVINPLGSPSDPNPANRPTVVARTALGSIAHEGYAQDKNGNIYVADENFPGALYRFVPANDPKNFNPKDPSTSPLAKGQLFALSISSPTLAPGGGTIGGIGSWVPLNNPDGTPLAGVPDPTVDARATVAFLNNPANGDKKIAAFNRPEDIDIRTAANGKTFLYTGATGAALPDLSGNVLSIEVTDPAAPVVRVFAGQNTIDKATGLAVGRGFIQPDNVAVDPFKGTVCFTEDIGNSANPTNGNPPAFPNNGNNPVDDLFCAVDANNDGVAESISRLATLATNFAEPTGVLFDPFVENQLYVNVQHAATGRIDQFGNFVPDGLTGNDLIVQFNVPEPATLSLLGMGLTILILTRRRRQI